MERSAGATVCDRLELLREEPSSVGVQVFGPTWVVLDNNSGELARACLLDDELLPTPELRDAFVAATADLAQVRDPALVPQLFAGADADGGAVLYEPVSGGVAFGELYDGTGSYELAVEVGRLARQLARALAALHQRGRVHGMLTAESVFVGPRGPSVYQYGLAPLCDRTVLMRRIRAFDLPGVAPEVLADGPFTPAADLYAWAVTVAQFAAGARGSDAIAAVRDGQDLPGVSSGLRAALHACLSEEPGGRPHDAGDLLRRLESAGMGDASGMMPAPPEVLEPVVTPPTPTPAPPAPPSPPPPPPRPPGAKDRPPTLPPQPGMTLPVTSFEEMLLTGDRQRRPGTIPPGSLSARPPEPLPARPPEPLPRPPEPLSARPPEPAPRFGNPEPSRPLELGPEDLMHESGAWTKSGQPTGKSSSALRRVHLLTDPVRRDGAEGLAPQASDKPTDRPAESGDVIIGGTREEVEAASRATTVRLDPSEAAAAVKAASAAHAASGPLKAVATPEVPAVEPPPSEVPRGDVPHVGTGPADSARRRSSAVPIAVSDQRSEPQDWGKIPTMKHATVPPAPMVPVPSAQIDIRRPPLPLILAGVGFLLLLIIIFSR